MKRILITGANSYIGTSFEKYLADNYPEKYVVDTIDMVDGAWHGQSFHGYDSLFHVAGIAHSDSGKISQEKEKLYYEINTELTIETAKKAKGCSRIRVCKRYDVLYYFELFVFIIC
jgi:UDP-glucose 4-epimerase